MAKKPTAQERGATKVGDMTIREQMAATILAGILANPQNAPYMNAAQSAALAALSMADALLLLIHPAEAK